MCALGRINDTEGEREREGKNKTRVKRRIATRTWDKPKGRALSGITESVRLKARARGFGERD